MTKVVITSVPKRRELEGIPASLVVRRKKDTRCVVCRQIIEVGEQYLWADFHLCLVCGDWEKPL